MSYDAGLLACCISEIRTKALGGRVEKVLQPTGEELVLLLRCHEGGGRLSIHCGNAPRIQMTSDCKENPLKPPMLCLLLRKHLQGSILREMRQHRFDRVAELVFDGRDEMGFPTSKKLFCELMGTYSNLIFTDGDNKIQGILRPGEALSERRMLLVGATYSLPDCNGKSNPLECDEESFLSHAHDYPGQPIARFLSSVYYGFSALIWSEIAFAVTGDCNGILTDENKNAVFSALQNVVKIVQNEHFSPCLVQKEKGLDISFLTLSHLPCVPYSHASEMLDDFYREIEQENYIRSKASDLVGVVHRAEKRITKKLLLQQKELEESRNGERYKELADLINGNLYLIKDGMESVTVTDWNDQRKDGTFGTKEIQLNTRLSPSKNAQAYYKKYTKSKNAVVELTKQIALGREDLSYLETVGDALSRASSARELDEIREELTDGGYMGKSREKGKITKKKPSHDVLKYQSPNGYTVLCGKNNLQNEYLTHKVAEKWDYWFHVKNMPGSHVILVTGGEEPKEEDFTFSAHIAVANSKARGQSRVEVDYTKAKNVKKPPNAKPGFVIYHENFSCIVDG